MVLPEPPLQRHRKAGNLRPHPPDRQVRQHLAAPLSVDQRLDHRPSQLRRDRRGNRVDLDPGVLQHVPEPGDLADPLLGDLRPVADHVPHRLDLSRGDEAARQQPALQQLRQPLRIGQVGLAPRHVLHVPGVADQHPLEIAVLQQRMVDGHRVDPGRLHRHVGDALRDQPLSRLGEHPIERLVRPLDRDPAVRTAAGLADRDRDHVLADVNPRAPLVENLHAAPPPRTAGKNAHAARGAPGRTKRLMPALAAQPGKHPKGQGLQRQSNARPRTAKPSRRQRATYAPAILIPRERARQRPSHLMRHWRRNGFPGGGSA